MKYNKKTPYFQEGNKIQGTGKTREEILAESKRLIELGKSEEASAAKQKQLEGLRRVGTNFNKPTATVNMPVDTRSVQIENTVGQTVPKTRGQAFQAARKRGDKEFT